MQMPLCEMCARTDTLCSGCEQKLQTGKMSELDIKVSRLLFQINETHNISEATFVKALDLGRTIMLLSSSDVGILIGREGKVVSELSHQLGKKVRIAEYNGDVKKSISDMVMPVRLLGINKVYHQGAEVTKVRLPRGELRNLPVDIDSLEKAIKSLMGNDVQLVFE